MKKLIEISNISVDKNEKKILKNISLDIHKGEKILIQGDSGSGKSTLLRSILFFENFYPGEIKFNDDLINEDNIETYRLNFSFLSQKLPYFYETVKDFLYLPLKYKNNKNLIISEDKIDNFFHIFNMKRNLLKKEYNKISDGEKQRVCIIQSLLLSRNIMLLDEITSNLDKKNSINVIKQIIGDNKKTVIAVSHDHLWDKYCSRKITIEEGKIIEDIAL